MAGNGSPDYLRPDGAERLAAGKQAAGGQNSDCDFRTWLFLPGMIAHLLDWLNLARTEEHSGEGERGMGPRSMNKPDAFSQSPSVASAAMRRVRLSFAVICWIQAGSSLAHRLRDAAPHVSYAHRPRAKCGMVAGGRTNRVGG